MKVTKKAQYEFLKQKLKTNNVWALRALQRIYQNQTEEEKNKGRTIEHNYIGFTGFDADFLTSLANQKTPYSERQMTFLRKTISKYWRQVYELSDKDKLLRKYLEENSQLTLNFK